MEPLRSVWSTGADLLAQVIDRDPPQFFCPIAVDRPLPELPVGTVISVVVAVEDREAEFHVHARVIDRRDGAVKRGLTLEIIPEERDRWGVILIAARGESFPYRRRRHSRVPVEFPCELSAQDGRKWRGLTTNVNKGGLHVAVDGELPEPELRVDVWVQLPEDEWNLRGRVAIVIGEGPQRGIGIEFLFSSAEQRDGVQRAVVRLLDALNLTDPV